MKKMFIFMVFVAMLSVLTSNAATVTWSSQLLASDGSNIINTGTEHVGVSYGSNAGDNRVINGVNFKANDSVWNHDNPNWSGWINDRNGYATRYGAAGTPLKELNNDIVYGGTLVLEINNLTIGHAYRIQLISYDASNCWNTPEAAIERWQTIAAPGGTEFSFQHGTQSPYAGINDVGAALVIGTWTADATEIDFTISGLVGVEGNMNDNAIINGFVVQDLSPKAVNVAPVNNAIGVMADSMLQWQAPRDPNYPNLPLSDTVSFIVYCDPNEFRLNAATYDNHAGVPYYSDQLLTGNIEDDLIQSFNPDPDLAINTKYYWRVDTRLATAAEPNDVYRGNVWTFNTDMKPVINVQPADQLVYSTENAAFTVNASDPSGGGMSYQWYHNNVIMPGKTLSTLTLSAPLSVLDQGFYACKITNSGGEVSTNDALLVLKKLVSHWALDGNTVDSASGYDGSLVGDPNWVAGFVGPGSIKLNGSNEGAIVVLDAYYPVSRTQFTVSAWVFVETRTSWASVLKNWSDSVGGMVHLGLDASGNNLDVQVTQASGNTVILNEGVLFPLGQWQHIAAVADGSKVRLYRNGLEVGTAVNYDGTLRVEIPYLSIGFKTGDDGLPSTFAPGYWSGNIDDVLVYNYSKTAEEIAQIYYDGSGTAACVYPPTNDLNGDCVVDLVDFSLIAVEWLECGRYPVAGCP